MTRGVNGFDVAAELERRIMSGELRAGDRVREERVARALGVSRTPVREAIHRLVSQGLLTKNGNHSARVFRPSMQDLLEIYEIREPLEVIASRRAAERATPEFVQRLRARLASFDDPAMTDWTANDEAFHWEIFFHSDRARLLEVIKGLRSQSIPYVRFATRQDTRYRRQAEAQHYQLVDAIAAHDTRAVGRLVHRHLAITTARVRVLLDAGMWIPPTPRAAAGTPESSFELVRRSAQHGSGKAMKGAES